MQVPQVTEEVAMAILDLYLTLLSLASAYSQLVRPDSLNDFEVCYNFLCSIFASIFSIYLIVIMGYTLSTRRVILLHRRRCLGSKVTM